MIDFINYSRALLQDNLFHVVIILCAVDIVVGTIRAILDKEIQSSVSKKGITNHVLTILVIILMNRVLSVIGYKDFTKIFIAFYIASYAISIIESTGKMGVKYPKFIKNIFTELQETTDENKRPKER